MSIKKYVLGVASTMLISFNLMSQCPNCPGDLENDSGTFCGPCSYTGTFFVNGNITWESSGSAGNGLTVTGNLVIFGSLTVDDDARVDVGGNFRPGAGGTATVNGYINVGNNLGVAPAGTLNGSGYIEYGNNANINGTLGGAFVGCGGGGSCGDASTLPVELTSFEVTMKNGNAFLEWATSSEKINEGFDIEKSNDGENWVVIGFVEGNGTSNDPHSYSFLDIELVHDSYYRLKQLDYDGNFEYSHIVFIPKKGDLTISPNPTSGRIKFHGNPNTIYTISVFDISGRSVMPYDQMSLLKAETYFEYLIPNLLRGTYIIKVQNLDYKHSIRLVKK